MTNKTINIKLAEQTELEKFSKMASQWWDLTGPCQPLHQINPIRLKFIQDHAELKNKSVVDVGCGGGILSEGLAQAGAEVTGIDLNNDLIDIAKLHLYESKLNINYSCTRIESFSLENQQMFDVIVCMELLEHVEDPKTVIQNCMALAKPGAKLFFSTINKNLKAYLKAVIAAEYIMRLLPAGTHDYDKFIKPSELCQAAREYNLELIALSGFDYNPLQKTFFATDDISVNYMACFQLIS